MNGVILIDKPEGLTSHDVVAQVRKMCSTKKVGHAGTLDPFATGLLVLCVGKATRIVEYVTGCNKEYAATMRLGESTDTQDLTGRTMTRRPVPEFSGRQLDEVFAGFVGGIAQVPPMFSAKKINGTRLYTLARQGKVVERAARAVTIHSLKIHAVALPEIDFHVTCSSGTYIRTLAHDIGERLGCGAHVTALRRTRIGDFLLESAVSLEHLAELTKSEGLGRVLNPIDTALTCFPAITVTDALMQKILHGVRLEFPITAAFEAGSMGCRIAEFPRHEQICRIYSENGRFLGLAQWSQSQADDADTWILRPRKVLVNPDCAEKP